MEIIHSDSTLSIDRSDQAVTRLPHIDLLGSIEVGGGTRSRKPRPIAEESLLRGLDPIPIDIATS